MPYSVLGDPLEIKLESSDLVLRGYTGDEYEPALLKGELVVNLTEDTNFREILLAFQGVSKVAWRDSHTHHYDHPLFHHDFALLSGSNNAAATTSGRLPAHSHTLPAGRHVFPFSLHVPGSLPASLRTYSGSCVTEYKLKAIAARPGFAADWKAKRLVRVARGFGPDAVEFNQTLEIENTWPNKVMYSFTIPHKAYAAGDTIPVSAKFSPLGKGIRITNLTTSIREHTQVFSKNSNHVEQRDATTVKHSFVDEGPHPRTQPNTHGGASTPNSATPTHSGAATPANEDDGVDTEIDAVIEVPIPVWTTPSHVLHPAFVHHKIKWSAFIKNPDGHVSELRCALPIHILPPNLSEEARLASTGTRNLLFGESGCLTRSDVPQADLPSYADHVKDRVANAETVSSFSLSQGFQPTAWSSLSTPAGTPLQSPGPSRPPSPGARRSSAQGYFAFPSDEPEMSHRSPPMSTPGSPSGRIEDHRNWVDSELLDTLNLSGRGAASPSASRPSSRPSSRAASRAQSRAASPERGGHERHDPPSSGPSPADHSFATSPSSSSMTSPPSETQTINRRDHNPFHLHLPGLPKMRPLTGFSRNSSHSSLRELHASESAAAAAGAPGPSAAATSSASQGASASALSKALERHAAKPQQRRHNTYETFHHAPVSDTPVSNPSAASSPLSTSPGAHPFLDQPETPHSATFPTGHSARSAHSPAPPLPRIATNASSPSPYASSSAQSPVGSHFSSGREGVSEETMETPMPHHQPLADVDYLSQVPSYEVARRGFLGGGVVPLNRDLPNYEDVQRSSSSRS